VNGRCWPLAACYEILKTEVNASQSTGNPITTPIIALSAVTMLEHKLGYFRVRTTDHKQPIPESTIVDTYTTMINPTIAKGSSITTSGDSPGVFKVNMAMTHPIIAIHDVPPTTISRFATHN
jgi:hypothetical protein